MLFHRKMEPWEVVQLERVDPVPTYTAEECDDLDIVDRYDATMCGLYTFDLRKATDLRAAVVFAQQRLMADAAVKGYNVFLTEGWRATHMRKGTRHRAEVRYWGRPALAANKPPETRAPPFLAIIDVREEETDSSSDSEPKSRAASLLGAVSLRRWSNRRTSSEDKGRRFTGETHMTEVSNEPEAPDSSSDGDVKSCRRRGNIHHRWSRSISNPPSALKGNQPRHTA